MFADCDRLSGFHELERDELGPFVWTTGRFQTRTTRAGRFAALKLCYNGERGALWLQSPRGCAQRVPLCQGWHVAVVELGDVEAGDVLEWEITPPLNVPGDARELGVALRSIELFSDRRRYDMIGASQRNLALNQAEFLTGNAELASFPPQLRITAEVRCNLPETGQACVYCSWDWAKDLERGSPPFTLQTLDDLGEFYRSAIEIVDCSYGEPTMNKQFGDIVAAFDRDGKQYSLTSNGQLLSPKRRRELWGKNLLLYVSIDSATAAGYTRYRNDRFDDIIAGLTALCREKKEHGDLPRVYASFIAMRSNVAELPEYFALMRQVGVDEVKLRMLYLDENVPLVTTNNGYRFDYADELLDADELAALGPRARALAAEHGVAVYVEWEQFARDTALGGAPLCGEPWKTMYAMRRGIMPCCYAREPLATWDEQGERPLDTFLQDVFNGAAYQEIRSELAAGRLADYCLNTPSCPILREMRQAGTVDAPDNSLVRRAFATPERLPMVPLEALTQARKQAG